MATQDVFSAEELARLRGFPEINRAELIRYFTLTDADEAFVRQFRVADCWPFHFRNLEHSGTKEVERPQGHRTQPA